MVLDDGLNVGTAAPAPPPSPPTSSDTKATIVRWLQAAGVDVTADELTKAELLDLVSDLAGA